MPEVFLELLLTISDRDKGLNAGKQRLELPDTVVHTLRCQHLKENVTKGRGGPPLNSYFWKIVKAPTVEKFAYHMSQLRSKSVFAASYLEKVDPALYAEAYVPTNRYGHLTSNVNESINSVLKIDRGKDVLMLLRSIWDRVMQSRFSKILRRTGTGWSPKLLDSQVCRIDVQESRSFSGGLRVQMSNESTAKIATPEGLIYTVKVDWETRRNRMHCSCKRPHATELSCGHVMAMLLHQKKNVQDFIPWAWSTYNWMNQHSTPVPVVRVDNLSTSPENLCFPPQTRVPRGL